MVSLKALVAVMATFSLAEAYYKHDGKKKYSCSDTCASEMRLIKGYEEDCYQFLAKVVPGSVGHPSKVPKQYKYICSGTIDFVNACYCLAPEEPDYATDKHVKDINGRYANDEYVNNELFTNELFTNERFNDERVNNNRFNNERPSNERANNDSVNSDSVNNEDDPTAARDTVFIPQTVSTTITEPTTTTTTEPTTTTTTEPTTTTTTESTTSITIEATTSTTTESITITTTESTTATVTAIIAEANCPTCPATCDSPFTCGGTMSYCNGGNTCICFGTTEGGTICALSSDCLSSEQCTSSNDCQAGQKCISQNCCGFNVCVAEATNEQCDPAS
ncbi:hypothetical protein ACHAPY_008648 [Fusarium culmorum]